MANSDSQRRCVFVGNIPYDATEEQLVQICEEVGPVVSFRLVIDRETGKPKGYGFCEYKDEETALSARRNLQGYEINGRQLRVDFAENDKNADRSREQGRGGPGMVTNVDPQKHFADSALHQPMGMSVAMTAAAVMAGALGAAQTSSSFSQSGVDPLTLHLSKMSRGHLTDIMTEFKAMSIQRKEQARQLLLAYPNLCKAIFQMQLMLGMVTQTMLQMPNIRQSAAPPLQPLLPDGQRSQHLATQTLPGLPPLPPSLLPQARPQVQLPQPMQNQVLQQSQLPTHSGTFPPMRPQMNLPIIPPVQVASSLKQQMPPSFLREAGPVASTNLAYNNMSFQPSSLTRPSLSEQSFQGNRPALTGTLDNVNRDSHGHQVTNSSSLFSKPAHSSGFPEEKRRSINNLDPLSQPTKIQRLNDGRTSYSSPDVSVATSTSGPSSQVSVAEMVSNSDKQSTQMQLPPDVESALLQQVLSLTPEQLSSLPPDQQQQVIQLQQMLRQPT